MADAVAGAVAGFKNEGRDSDAISGRVSAHEILRTRERSEGAEAEKEKLPTCPNQQMDLSAVLREDRARGTTRTVPAGLSTMLASRGTTSRIPPVRTVPLL